MDTELKQWLEEFSKDIMCGMGEMNKRLDRIEVRLDRIEERLDRVEERLDRVEERLDRVEERLDRIEERLDRVEGRLDKLEASFKSFKTETRKNFKEVYQKFAETDKKLDRLIKGQDLLKNQMDERFKLVIGKLDALEGKPAVAYTYSRPDVQAISTQVRESAIPYLQDSFGKLRSSVLENAGDLEYAASLCSSCSREFDEIRRGLMQDVQDMIRPVSAVEVHTPDQLKEREELLSALPQIFDRLCVCSSGFPGYSERQPGFLDFIKENGFDELMKLWGERTAAFEEMEAEALSLLERAERFCAESGDTGRN